MDAGTEDSDSTEGLPKSSHAHQLAFEIVEENQHSVMDISVAWGGIDLA